MKPNLSSSLEDKLRFLVLKTRQQMEVALEAMDAPLKTIPVSVRIREDYIDNLKSLVEHSSFDYILNTAPEDKFTLSYLRALIIITGNLERIGDFAVNIMAQTRYFESPGFMKQFEYLPYFRHIFSALGLIPGSFLSGETNTALKICEAEFKLDLLYKNDFDRIMAILKTGENTGDAVTALFILRYLERVGDSLLNIGEAIISAFVGAPIKIHEYRALQDTVGRKNGDFYLQNMAVETKSGSKIDKVVSVLPDSDIRESIFKEGNRGKLKLEKEKLQIWEKAYPGMTPKVLEFHEHEEGLKASLVMEYLQGFHLQEIVLGHDADMVRRAMNQLIRTVGEIWKNTRSEKPANALFMEQLQHKIRDIFTVHPQFIADSASVGTCRLASLEELMSEVRSFEHELPAPFSVLIHGDFNTDNIIFNTERDKIYYIDLHRSEYGDYLQDVSVFLISNFRAPIFDRFIRERINKVTHAFYTFAVDFARRNGDSAFAARLSLGLARSFATSTRFAAKKDFAREMYMRSVFTLENLLRFHRSGRPWSEYALNEDVLIYHR